MYHLLFLLIPAQLPAHLILTMWIPLSLTTFLILLQTPLRLDQGILLDLASCKKTSHYSITSSEFYLLMKLLLDAVLKKQIVTLLFQTCTCFEPTQIDLDQLLN
ncbi:hypothetical protein BDR06DRAFT_976276 [Suillus hirtellus]|nr:hypothetical protein BDR06DRAFT_976276 [Suillus hirtellus]